MKHFAKANIQESLLYLAKALKLPLVGDMNYVTVPFLQKNKMRCRGQTQKVKIRTSIELTHH